MLSNKDITAIKKEVDSYILSDFKKMLNIAIDDILKFVLEDSSKVTSEDIIKIEKYIINKLKRIT